MRLSLVVALLALALVAVALPTTAQNYNTYSPGPQVRQWTTNTPLTDTDEAQDYGMDVGMQRVAPVIIVGLLSFLAILIWTCCRCCCDKCRLRSADSCCTLVLGGLLFACAISGLALIIVGFEASADQDTAFNNVPTVVDSAVQWVDDLSGEIDGLLTYTAQLTFIGQEMLRVDNGTGVVDQDTIDSLDEASQLINESSNAVDDLAADAGIDDFQDSFAQDVDDYNAQRRTYVNIVLGVLLGLIAIEVTIALLNGFAGEGCQPKQNCFKYLTPIIGILSIIVLLLLWIVSGALVGVMTGLSDVCIDPDTSIIGLAEVTDDIPLFFIRCDEDDTLSNPFEAEVQDLSDGFDDAQDAITELYVEVTNSSECRTYNLTLCDELGDLLEDANNTIGNLSDAIGIGSFDSSGNAQSGVLRLVSCTELNSRYQLVLNVLCGDAAEALGKSTSVLLGFAVLYVVTLILTRLLTDVGLAKNKQKKVAPEASTSQLNPATSQETYI